MKAGPLKGSAIWGYFVANSSEETLSRINLSNTVHLSKYGVRGIVPVRGKTPPDLAEGWTMIRVETTSPLPLLEHRRSKMPQGSSFAA